ncbi:TetR/AcrR family transcriptional regulator [Actinorugispora endophytica]|uniref:TetR family transcriptional regulator n=1 Tax=Actinorugispora endophytica TaxID=1605990 RepID=A0A4R6ULE2_9ACTN|nr:TetR/AcrR family transcriptional regulator [Actinorugispora endophytica]TDQ46329.1 TetR family transcriptional regulator [Actinorugispora endophytica]
MTTEHTSGTSDPARSLALLWRGGERAGRRGKHDLSVDRVVRAAIELADTEGVAALSMRKVAERLGVGTMSLYTYVPGKSELVDVMVDTVHGELGRHHEAPGGWRARLELIARDNWALCHRHPWLLQVLTSRPPLGPNISLDYEYQLRAIDGIGLSDLEMDSVTTLVTGYVHGAARGSVDAARDQRDSGLTDEQWWDTQAPFLRKVMEPGRFPVSSRVGAAAGEAYNAASDPDQAFEFGLARVLDGLQVFIDRKADAAPER